jgi:hypothetical protein
MALAQCSSAFGEDGYNLEKFNFIILIPLASSSPCRLFDTLVPIETPIETYLLIFAGGWTDEASRRADTLIQSNHPIYHRTLR